MRVHNFLGATTRLEIPMLLVEVWGLINKIVLDSYKPQAQTQNLSTSMIILMKQKNSMERVELSSSVSEHSISI